MSAYASITLEPAWPTAEDNQRFAMSQHFSPAPIIDTTGDKLLDPPIFRAVHRAVTCAQELRLKVSRACTLVQWLMGQNISLDDTMIAAAASVQTSVVQWLLRLGEKINPDSCIRMLVALDLMQKRGVAIEKVSLGKMMMEASSIVGVSVRDVFLRVAQAYVAPH